MKSKTVIHISLALLLCAAAWLAGRHSAGTDHSHVSRTGPEGHSTLPASAPTGPEQADHRHAIPASALQSIESFENWFAEIVDRSGPKPKPLWVYRLAQQHIRAVEAFSGLDDDSVKALGNFFLRSDVREHFRDSQTFPRVINEALAELARRDRTALKAWIAQSGDFYRAHELTLAERLELAQQAFGPGTKAEDSDKAWRVALRVFRPGEIGEATRIVENLPAEKRAEGCGQLAFGMATSFIPKSEWQTDLGPVFDRAFPGKEAGELRSRQTLYKMFRDRLAGEESAAECAAWLQTQSMPPPLRAAAATELMSAWMSFDTLAAADWRLQFDASDDKASVLKEVVSKWTSGTTIRTPLEVRVADAAEWLTKAAPGPEADRARATLAKAWSALGETEAANSWTAAITDPARREKTLQAVTNPKESVQGEAWQKGAAASIAQMGN